VKNMERMFYECSGLADATALSDWDVSNLENREEMFEKCESLKKYPAWYLH
jgi:hypothetical protein